MTGLLIFLCLLLIAIIAVQIGRVTELAAKLRGEEEVQERSNRNNGIWLMAFMIIFLVACVVSGVAYKDYFLGFGPHQSASAHGAGIDAMFNWTLFFTGIVFFLTQIALFYFSYKYRQRKGNKAMYISHNNTLEIVWTAIPAVVMTFLVIGGLDVWNDVMADVGTDEDVLEIEATGYQFAWQLRYPGPDNKLGTKNFRLITANNQLGQDWTDEKNHDDFLPNELVLPKGQRIRVRITARDVLHDFYLPQFRVKMDAVPGLPTYFIFTPEKTTEEYRAELKEYDTYNQPDPKDPEKMLWETFDYELACAELCGRGHWSMYKKVRVVEPEEYERWAAEQQSYYLQNIRGKEEDPLKDQLLEVEILERRQQFADSFQAAVEAELAAEKVVTLNYVQFATGSADLTPLSTYELDNLYQMLRQSPELVVEVGGHTDVTGAAADNQVLSQQRAEVVRNYLLEKGISPDQLQAVGYGSSQPVATGDSEEDLAKNRRTEVRILGATEI